MKDIEDVIWYLRIEISYLKNRLLLPSQKKYIYDLLLYYGIENCSNIAIFIMHNLKFSKDLDKHICDAKTQTNYRILLE